LIGRLTALSFEFVHAGRLRLFGWRDRKAAWNRSFIDYLGGKSKLGQHLTRMGASREGAIAFA
jgi:hypothetical protein